MYNIGNLTFLNNPYGQKRGTSGTNLLRLSVKTSRDKYFSWNKWPTILYLLILLVVFISSISERSNTYSVLFQQILNQFSDILRYTINIVKA